MFEYIRGLYLFTATCNSWKKLLLETEYQKIILECFSFLKQKKLCTIYGFVIMPNHIHVLMGADENTLSGLQQRMLKYTAQQILRKMKLNKDPNLKYIESTQADRKYHFWERKANWKSIYTSDIFWQKLRYVHNNPLQEKWSLCSKPEDYQFSSAKSYRQLKPEFDFLSLYE